MTGTHTTEYVYLYFSSYQIYTDAISFTHSELGLGSGWQCGTVLFFNYRTRFLYLSLSSSDQVAETILTNVKRTIFGWKKRSILVNCRHIVFFRNSRLPSIKFCQIGHYQGFEYFVSRPLVLLRLMHWRSKSRRNPKFWSKPCSRLRT